MMNALKKALGVMMMGVMMTVEVTVDEDEDDE